MKLSATGENQATPTGLEPATSAVTGRRANQLRYGALGKALTAIPKELLRIPNGIRTRATAVKGRGPRPLDDGGEGNALDVEGVVRPWEA